MKVLVLGASGATGRLVVTELIRRHIETRIVARAGAILPAEFADNPSIEIERGNITEYDNQRLTVLIQGCDAVVSCLGHNISFKGMFGAPRNLVSDTIKRICVITKDKTGGKLKLILMSTTAYTNSVAGERNVLGEKVILSILKIFLPPHRDNMEAADHLLRKMGRDIMKLEWVAVRPDTLVDETGVTAYSVHESPVRSPLFNAGKTSRINVSHFMVDLLETETTWLRWKFRMPVIYNENTQ